MKASMPKTNDKAISIAKGPVPAEGGMPPPILDAALIGPQLAGKAVRLDAIAPFYMEKDVGRILYFPQQALTCAKFKGNHFFGDATARA